MALETSYFHEMAIISPLLSRSPSTKQKLGPRRLTETKLRSCLKVEIVHSTILQNK